MKELFILFFTFYASLFTFEVLSQQPTLEWVAKYPDSLNVDGTGYVMKADNDGNLVVAGLVIINNIWHYGTIKYSSAGEKLWSKLYNGNNDGGRKPYAIAIDANKNVYVTGYGFQTGQHFDYLTIKYDSYGNEIWIKYYNGFANDEDVARAIVGDNSCNIYVTGWKSVGGSSFVYCTIKYNTEGEELWVTDYGPSSSGAGPYAMVIDGNSNLYITGFLNNRATTVSYDSSGNFRWAQEYADHSWGNAITLDRNNDIYVTGYCGASMYYQFFTIKYNLEGNVQWARNYQKCDTMGCNSEAKNIAVDNEGNIVVSGTSSNVVWGGNAATIIKYTNTGDTVWLINKDPIPGTSIGELNMAVDSFSDIYLTGRVRIPPYVSGSYYTFKYNSTGELQWIEIFGGVQGWSAGTTPRAIIADNLGNIYVTGVSKYPVSGFDKITTIKYSQPIGLIQISSNIPKEYKLEQNYPNPFNPVTNFEFRITHSGFVKLTVYDVLGKEIAELVNENLKPGSYRVNWNASNFSSGLYFYTLQTSEFKETKKMVILR